MGVTVHPDVPRAVRGDRLRVGQILTNLLSNAVKFTAQGEIDVEVRVAERRDDATVVSFEVRDTGIGVDPKRLARLFDPFSQADISTTRQYGGSGLGLTICRDLTRLMGGTIEAHSKPGHGSRFRFEIPLAPATSEPLPPAAPADLRGLRVLVAVADPAVRRALDPWLVSWSMRPSFAGDADEAYEQLLGAAAGGEPFEVALLDIGTTGPGDRLPERIGASPRLRGTRMIVLAASDEAPVYPGLAHLTKPLTQSRVLAAIQAAIGRPLPVLAAKPDPVPEPEPEPAPAASARAARAFRILAAEDNPANRLYIERLVTRAGHTASLAVDGRDALRLYEAEPFDLILMDCQMPELDGYEVTGEIRRREWDERRERMPIVAMTAGALEGAREECLRAGMDDYVSKPFDERDLVTILDRWLPAADGEQILDPNRIAELRELFPGEMASAMWGELVATVSADLASIAAAMESADPDAVAKAAHRVRGSGAMLGAAALIEAATDLQGDAQRAAAGGEPVDPAAVAVLSARWNGVLRAIREQPDGPAPFAAAASDREGDRPAV
jgi:CheY-like chemotaxis protein